MSYTTGLFLRLKGAQNDGPAYDPKAAEHPSVVGMPCFGCGVLFVAGDVTTLVALGPGYDEDERELARAGRFYSAMCVELHWVCATGQLEPTEADR